MEEDKMRKRGPAALPPWGRMPWVLSLLWTMSSLSLVSEACNEAVCASIVSKCTLLKSCECQIVPGEQIERNPAGRGTRSCLHRMLSLLRASSCTTIATRRDFGHNKFRLKHVTEHVVRLFLKTTKSPVG